MAKQINEESISFGKATTNQNGVPTLQKELPSLGMAGHQFVFEATVIGISIAGGVMLLIVGYFFVFDVATR